MLSFPRCVAAITFALALFACDPGAPAAPPLNSERIEQVFGSYGVEVLFSDAILRVSSLYSTDDSVRTTRTFAVVAWPPVADPRLAEPQTAIQGGASIGATLEAAGWTVRKRNLFYGETPAAEALGRLMRVPSGSMLAMHGYSLIVERGGQSSYYATIAEIHHPDYLDLDTVEAIYGRAELVDATTGPTIRSLVEEGFARLTAQPSGGGE